MTKRLILSSLVLAACGEAPTAPVTSPEEFVMSAVISPSIPTFSPPVSGSFNLINFMDHNTPQQGTDANGVMHVYWNEKVNAGVAGTGGHIDGHSGYDWAMPVGTPLVAVAAGKVTAAFMTHAPFWCQALNQNVTDNATIEIVHDIVGGIRVVSRYVHVDAIQVSVGQTVTSGQAIGRSGNRGCSLSPHLHFETRRLVNNAWRVIDPYGWQDTDKDPWSVHPQGAESIALWKGRPPELFREKALPPNPAGSQALVTITKVRWMGVKDAAKPNNEFIELTLDTNYGSQASLAGFQIKGDRSNFTYNIPSSAVLTTANPTIRIYTGSGANSASTLYMGRNAPMWSNNFDDCARRINANVSPPLVYTMSLGGTC